MEQATITREFTPCFIRGLSTGRLGIQGDFFGVAGGGR